MLMSAGRLRVEQSFFTLPAQPGPVQFFHAPALLEGLMTPEALVALTVRKAINSTPATSNVPSTVASTNANVKQETAQGTAQDQRQSSQPPTRNAGAGDVSKQGGHMELAGSMRLTLTEEVGHYRIVYFRM
jgi:hypothetical protein